MRRLISKLVRDGNPNHHEGKTVCFSQNISVPFSKGEPQATPFIPLTLLVAPLALAAPMGQRWSPNPLHEVRTALEPRVLAYFYLWCEGNLYNICSNSYDTRCNVSNGRFTTGYTSLCGEPHCQCREEQYYCGHFCNVEKEQEAKEKAVAAAQASQQGINEVAVE